MAELLESVEKFNFKDKEAWKKAIDAAPNSSWVESRNLGANKKSKYVPIAIQQALADIFFDEINVIEEKYQVIINEILCTVKISALPSYPNAEHQTFTGTGSKPIQTDANSSVYKFPLGKKTNALEYNAPAARSAAITNALTTKGNVFGRNLGRAVSIDYNFRSREEKPKKVKKSKKTKDAKK